MKRAFYILPLFLGACMLIVGNNPKNYPPALRAAGTTAHITTSADTIRGELIEVSGDTALVVATPSRIVLVRQSSAVTMHFEDLDRASVQNQLLPDERAQLRLLSRYPQGTPPQAMAALLESRRQSTLIVIDK